MTMENTDETTRTPSVEELELEQTKRTKIAEMRIRDLFAQLMTTLRFEGIRFS